MTIPKRPTIYTLGYSGWKIEQIEAVLARLDAILIDVRMVPRSRAPIWNSGVLARRLGEASKDPAGQYVWLKEFGNRNYKGTFEQIEIADFPAGEQRLRELLGLDDTGPALRSFSGAGKAVILLCGCPDVNVCHRKLLADWLAHRWKTQVEHLTRPDNRNSGRQPTLF